jgi:hypothetical protein
MQHDDQDRIRHDVAHDVMVGGTALVSLGGMRTATLKVIAMGKDGITTVDAKARVYRFAWAHVIAPGKADAKVDDAKQVATAEAPDLTKAQGQEYRSVRALDEVYFADRDGTPMHGVVAAVGRHGATIDTTDESGAKTEHKVRFDKIIGHRKRAERRLKILDQGEDGAVCEDDTGARVFIRGKLDVGTTNPLHKAMPMVLPEPEIPEEWRDKVAQARVIRDLAAAGFEPMMDHVREVFGDDYVFRTVEPVHDDTRVLDAIERMSAQFHALASSIQAMTAHLATQGTKGEPPIIQIDNHMPAQPAPVVNVEPPAVTVAAPVVTLEMPAQRHTVTEIERDRDGNITRAIQKDAP